MKTRLWPWWILIGIGLAVCIWAVLTDPSAIGHWRAPLLMGGVLLMGLSIVQLNKRWPRNDAARTEKKR